MQSCRMYKCVTYVQHKIKSILRARRARATFSVTVLPARAMSDKGGPLGCGTDFALAFALGPWIARTHGRQAPQQEE